MKFIFAMMFMAQSVFAVDIPKVLLELIPVGGSSVRLEGITPDGELCVSDIGSVKRVSFSVKNLVTDEDSVKVLKSAGSQIGLGGELEDLEIDGGFLEFKTVHIPNDQHSSKRRSTVTVERTDDRRIISVRVVEQEKGWFRYKTIGDILCSMD